MNQFQALIEIYTKSKNDPASSQQVQQQAAPIIEIVIHMKEFNTGMLN